MAAPEVSKSFEAAIRKLNLWGFGGRNCAHLFALTFLALMQPLWKKPLHLPTTIISLSENTIWCLSRQAQRTALGYGDTNNLGFSNKINRQTALRPVLWMQTAIPLLAPRRSLLSGLLRWWQMLQ